MDSVSIPIPEAPHPIRRVLHINELEHDEKAVLFPKHLIKALIRKWTRIFNPLLKLHKDVQILNACMDTVTFSNCYDVKFNSTHFTYNRLKKEFELHVTPMLRQDILCFGGGRRKSMFISVRSPKLRLLFVRFFEQINSIRFCSGCGNFSHSMHYYEDVDMCETCLFEEISASQRTEVKTCSICLEEHKRGYKARCGHFFHRKCLAQVSSIPYPRCPLCRSALDPADAYLDDEANRHLNHGDHYDEFDDEDDDYYSDDDQIHDEFRGLNMRE